jgi:hypothetical protein
MMPARLMSKPVGVKLAAEPMWTSVLSGPGMTRMLACDCGHCAGPAKVRRCAS